MAKSLIFLRNIVFRQNPRTIQNNSPYTRSFCGGGDLVAEELPETIETQKGELPETSETQKLQCLNQIAGEVLKVIWTRPTWEKTLLSDFPAVNFTDPIFFHELLKQQRNASISYRIFQWLRSVGFEPDKLTCAIVFDRLVDANDASAARSFLKTIDFVPELASLESYVKCLCANGNGFLEEAVSVFDEMKNLGICASLETWNSALLGSVRARQTGMVWKLYGDMMENGVGGDVDTVECIIQAYCIDNNLKEGLALLMQVLQDGVVPSLTTFNSLISGFCKERAYHKVSALMHTMIANDRLPDISTYQIIISWLCKHGRSVDAFRIFNDLKNRGYEPDLVMYAAIIALLCKRNRVEEALSLCFEMIHKGILPDAQTYGALINRLCMVGDVEGAKKLYKEMCSRGYDGRPWTYNIMARELSLHGKADEVLDLFGDKVKKGIVPDISREKEKLQEWEEIVKTAKESLQTAKETFEG